MIVAGIDSGSRTLKIVLWDTCRRAVLASMVEAQQTDPGAQAGATLARLCQKHGITRGSINGITATGYARNAVPEADHVITEITCQARGVSHLRPDAAIVVEIGGQDSKVIHLNQDGSVRDFTMNDRCAAGTGRFLEMVALRLGHPVLELGVVAARSGAPCRINSTCAVFAESEIVSLLSAGATPADIAAGVLQAVARRTSGLVGRAVSGHVIFSGGVALVPGMAEALAVALGAPIVIAPQPQLTGALGAALTFAPP